MPKTLLVTGASGLIGFEGADHFARALRCTVHGLGNDRRAAPAGGREIIFVDGCSREGGRTLYPIISYNVRLSDRPPA